MSLAHFDRRKIALAGGKGANLGELIRAGFQVPPGFVITTTAYDLLLQTSGLQSNIQEMPGSLHIYNPKSVSEISQKIRAVFQNASIPVSPIDQSFKEYRQLGSAAVAIRSSATTEDLPEAAFAGIA